MTLTAKLNYLFYVHTSLTLGLFCLIGGLIEFAVGMMLEPGLELLAIYVAYPAGGLLVCVFLGSVWSVIRWERKYAI